MMEHQKINAKNNKRNIKIKGKQMTSKLIKSLNLAIKSLKSGTFQYDYYKYGRCNCGVVISAILNIPPDLIERRIDNRLDELKTSKGLESWRGLYTQYCSVTGLSNVKIINELTKEGLTYYDIGHLEGLSHPQVIKEMGEPYYIEEKKEEKIITYKKEPRIIFGIKFGNRNRKIVSTKTSKKITWNYPKNNNKEELIKYLTAWVSILERNQELTGDFEKDKNEHLVLERSSF